MSRFQGAVLIISLLPTKALDSHAILLKIVRKPNVNKVSLTPIVLMRQ